MQTKTTASLKPSEIEKKWILVDAENAVVGRGHLDPGMQVMTKPFGIDALANRVRDMIDT